MLIFLKNGLPVTSSPIQRGTISSWLSCLSSIFGRTCAPARFVFDYRNHGQNVPVVPPNHNYEQLTRDLERVIQSVKVRLGERRTAGLFHSMSARTAMKHAIEIGWRWDALVLFDPPN